MARSRARNCTLSICVLSDLALLVDGEVQGEELGGEVHGWLQTHAEHGRVGLAPNHTKFHLLKTVKLYFNICRNSKYSTVYCSKLNNFC